MGDNEVDLDDYREDSGKLFVMEIVWGLGRDLSKWLQKFVLYPHNVQFYFIFIPNISKGATALLS